MRHAALFVSCSLLLSAPAAGADKLVLVAGGGAGKDGTLATKARLVQPFGVDFVGNRVVIVEGPNGERLRTIDTVNKAEKLVTLAGKEGDAGNGGDGLSGEDATFNGLHGLAAGPGPAVFLADTFNNRVRKYDFRTKSVTAFAGTGAKGFSGDGGFARDAKFGGCYCVSFDASNKNLYITDLDNRRVRKVDVKTTVVTTVAGNGESGVPKDGEDALKQPLVDPRAHALDRAGNLWIVERGGHALRVVDAKGKIRTAAGTGQKGMGAGKALEAALNGPKHLCVDDDGSVLIADTENHRVVRYSPKAGTIAVVAGTGTAGDGLGDGDPLKAELNRPHGVAVHPETGDVYISDSENGRVLKIVRGK
jgi:DNA-binding beta-propeller fold protein YncE